MGACELCWSQAFGEAQRGPESQAEAYRRLLVENEGKPGHDIGVIANRGDTRMNARRTASPTSGRELGERGDSVGDTTVPDAHFLAAVIDDNERWTTHGITTPDLAVVFEMSEPCDWGRTYSVSRLRAALKALAKMPTVTKRADRWFSSLNPTLDAVDDAGERLCARRGCPVDISHLRADARFCSPGCRNRASRRHQAADYPLQRPRSEDRETVDSEGAATAGPDGRFGALPALSAQHSGSGS